MKTWALLSFTACGFGLLLCGCGRAEATPVAPAVSPLAGNWLLVGPMPTNGISFPSSVSSGVRLAMTFDVVGDQVIAGGFGSNFCDNLQASFEFGDVAAGILAADGSFTATPANSPLETVSIKGTAPQKSGELLVRQLHGVFGRPTCACMRCESFRNIHSDVISIGERSLCWNGEHDGWPMASIGSASDVSSDAAAGRHE